MVSQEQSGDVWLVRFSGDVTGSGEEESLTHLANRAIQAGAKTCLADISGVRFMNSSGIGILLKLLTRFRNHGGEMYLLQPPESVRKLLAMTRLEAIFTIIESQGQIPGKSPGAEND